ncbi:unnamed protein product [Durusdinium trenchii]|uniref:Ubiquitin-like domain-containing protein n=1 Tax=Durusdinium trenchii TaxID=1381693 RepID=A0ABP0HZU4_9DINO
MPGNKANQPQQQKVSNREHCIICCPCIPLAVLALAAASPLPPACSTKSVMKEDNFGNGIVVIRVVGLDGEGFTLRLPESKSGYDVWKMAKDRLPCKSGAAVSIYNGSEKLAMSRTLREQGLGQDSTLS